MNARDRKIGGELTASGASLSVFKTSVDSLSAKLNLKATELELEELELERKSDLLHIQGKIDLSHEHNYSGTFNARVGNLAEYLSVFRGPGENNTKPKTADIKPSIDSQTSRIRRRIVVRCDDEDRRSQRLTESDRTSNHADTVSTRTIK